VSRSGRFPSLYGRPIRMKRTRFTEEQIMLALRQADDGTSVKEVCRKMQISEQRIHRWRRKSLGGGRGRTQCRSYQWMTLVQRSSYGVSITMGSAPTAPWATWLRGSSLHQGARRTWPDDARHSLCVWYRNGYKRRDYVTKLSASSRERAASRVASPALRAITWAGYSGQRSAMRLPLSRTLAHELAHL